MIVLDVLRAEVRELDEEIAATPWWAIRRWLRLQDQRSLAAREIAREINRIGVALIEEH